MKDQYSQLEFMSSFFCCNLYLVKNRVLLWLNRINFFQEILTEAIFSQNGGTLGYKFLFRLKYHYSLLERMPSFFSHNVYLRNKSRSFFAHCTIFCKKCLHKQFFLKMAEGRGINIYFIWKTTIVHLSMSSFFSCELYLRDKSRSFFVQWTIFCKKCLHKQFFLKMAERWGINIYVVGKTTIVSLSVCRAFFSYNPYLRDKSRSFLLTGRYFVKNDHKLFVLKMAEGWGINISFIWKTTIVHLNMSRFF